MTNKKQTSKELASKAGKILKDDNSSKIQKELAWSVLSQTSSWNETWSEMETKASNVLKSSKYSKDTRSLAGSLVSQSRKSR